MLPHAFEIKHRKYPYSDGPEPKMGIVTSGMMPRLLTFPSVPWAVSNRSYLPVSTAFRQDKCSEFPSALG